MVILIIGLLAGVSGPAMFKYVHSNQMDTRVDKMVADLQLSRAMAISTGQTHRFSTTNNGYTVKNLATGMELRNVTFDEGATLNGTLTADFFPWGMANTTTFDLSYHSLARRVQLLPTGMVEVKTL